TAAAVLIFFHAAARAGVVAADLWQGTANWQIDRYSTVSSASAVATDGCHCADWVTHARVGSCCWRGRAFLTQEELRQCCEEILERLQIGSAAEQIVQNFILNVRH